MTTTLTSTSLWDRYWSSIRQQVGGALVLVSRPLSSPSPSAAPRRPRRHRPPSFFCRPRTTPSPLSPQSVSPSIPPASHPVCPPLALPPPRRRRASFLFAPVCLAPASSPSAPPSCLSPLCRAPGVEPGAALMTARRRGGPASNPSQGSRRPEDIRSHRIAEGLLLMSLILAPKSSKKELLRAESNCRWLA